MNYVLGGGIVGLISAFYNKGYKILTKDNGQVFFGPRIIKRTDFVDLFIEKIMCDISPKIYKVGYFFNKNTQSIIDQETRISYLKKTRGDEWWKYIKSGMNNGDNIIEGYNMISVWSRLSVLLKQNYEYFAIRTIDLYKKSIRGYFLGKENTMDIYQLIYYKLINTIPAPIFNQFLIPNFSYKGVNIYHYLVESSNFDGFMKDYDFVYFPEKNIPFYRITRVNDSRFCVESLTSINVDDYVDCNVILKSFVNNAKINGDIPLVINPYIKHVGRYANWDNDLRTHDIIEYFEKKENSYYG